MGCSFMTKCAKWLLFSVNLLCSLLGAVILGVGIWVLIDKDSLFNLIKAGSLEQQSNKTDNDANGTSKTMNEDVDSANEINDYFNIAAYAAIGMGVLIIIINVLGCVGSIKESRGWLKGYGLSVIIMVLIEVTVVILLTIIMMQL